MRAYYDGASYTLVLDSLDDITRVKQKPQLVQLEGTTNQIILKYGTIDNNSGVEVHRVNDHTVSFTFNEDALKALMLDHASVRFSEKLWVHVDFYNDWYTHKENYAEA
jgi:hypothetical protein